MAGKPKKSRPGCRRGRWWALLRGPSMLPVLFATRKQARENRDPDEYMVFVEVRPVPRRRRQP